MNDAQIRLYAALRVAVPLGWRIYGRSGPEQLHVYFEREGVRIGLTSNNPRPHRVIAADDVFVVATTFRDLESPRGIERVVAEAQRGVGRLRVGGRDDGLIDAARHDRLLR